MSLPTYQIKYSGENKFYLNRRWTSEIRLRDRFVDARGDQLEVGDAVDERFQTVGRLGSGGLRVAGRDQKRGVDERRVAGTFIFAVVRNWKVLRDLIRSTRSYFTVV